MKYLIVLLLGLILGPASRFTSWYSARESRPGVAVTASRPAGDPAGNRSDQPSPAVLLMGF